MYSSDSIKCPLKRPTPIKRIPRVLVPPTKRITGRRSVGTDAPASDVLITVDSRTRGDRFERWNARDSFNISRVLASLSGMAHRRISRNSCTSYFSRHCMEMSETSCVSSDLFYCRSPGHRKERNMQIRWGEGRAPSSTLPSSPPFGSMAAHHRCFQPFQPFPAGINCSPMFNCSWPDDESVTGIILGNSDPSLLSSPLLSSRAFFYSILFAFHSNSAALCRGLKDSLENLGQNEVSNLGTFNRSRRDERSCSLGSFFLSFFFWRESDGNSGD